MFNMYQLLLVRIFKILPVVPAISIIICVKFMHQVNLVLCLYFVEQTETVNRTTESSLAPSCSSPGAVVPVSVVQVLSCKMSDAVPTSSTADSDIHIVVDKQAAADEGGKSNDSSIHIVVDDKTSTSRVVCTMVCL